MRDVEFSPTAYEQLKEWEQNDPKIYQRIEELILNILHDPFKGIGKPEPLKHQFQGYWSRRITKGHRLIYKVTEISVIVVACKYHY